MPSMCYENTRRAQCRRIHWAYREAGHGPGEGGWPGHISQGARYGGMGNWTWGKPPHLGRICEVVERGCLGLCVAARVTSATVCDMRVASCGAAEPVGEPSGVCVCVGRNRWEAPYLRSSAPRLPRGGKAHGRAALGGITFAAPVPPLKDRIAGNDVIAFVNKDGVLVVVCISDDKHTKCARAPFWARARGSVPESHESLRWVRKLCLTCKNKSPQVCYADAQSRQMYATMLRKLGGVL